MGKYIQGANGAFKGKVGSMIGSKWRSVNYIKGLPSPSSKPATQAQLEQRAKFALAISFMRPIKDVVNLGMADRKQTKLSGYNLALSRLLNQAVVGTYPSFSIDYSKVEISQGGLNQLNSAVMAIDAGVVKITWKSVLNKFNSFADDEVIVLLYNASKSMFMVYDELSRAGESCLPEMDETFSGDELHGWIFAHDRDVKSISPTNYLGQLVAP